MPLFEVAILETIKKKGEKDKENIILAPTSVVASNEQAAGAQAIRNNAKELPEDLDNVQVLVRPFV